MHVKPKDSINRSISKPRGPVNSRPERPLSQTAYVCLGHFALTDQVKFAAEKRSPWFESSGPAKTTDEESIHSLIDSP